jgi:hypothetical protein
MMPSQLQMKSREHLLKLQAPVILSSDSSIKIGFCPAESVIDSRCAGQMVFQKFF